MRLAPFALVAMLALAGCLAPSAITPQSTLSASAVTSTLKALLAGVPCEAKSVGEETSENLKAISQIEFSDATHGEIDVRGDWLLSARYQEGGFEVVNVADPTKPVKMGFFQSEEKTAYDVKWMPDNMTAVVGHNDAVELVDVTPVMAPGLTSQIVESKNISPKLIFSWQYPAAPPGHTSTNMHMLTTSRLAGVDYVFIAPNDDQGVAVLKLDGKGADRKLSWVGRIGDDEPMSGGPLGPHDMSLVWDEITGKPVLYVANGFEGWRAYDVTDPAKPVMLASMPNFGTAQGYTHTVIGGKVGDKRLVASIQEVGMNTMTIWDATDFAKPMPIAQWQADRTDPTTPEHNIQLLNGKLYVAHYTHGVYVFDLAKMDTSPTGFVALKPIAHFAPVRPEARAPASPATFANVWDVLVHDGLVYVNDEKAGVSVVGFGCLTPGDINATSVN